MSRVCNVLQSCIFCFRSARAHCCHDVVWVVERISPSRWEADVPRASSVSLDAATMALGKVDVKAHVRKTPRSMRKDCGSQSPPQRLKPTLGPKSHSHMISLRLAAAPFCFLQRKHTSGPTRESKPLQKTSSSSSNTSAGGSSSRTPAPRSSATSTSTSRTSSSAQASASTREGTSGRVDASKQPQQAGRSGGGGGGGASVSASESAPGGSSSRGRVVRTSSSGGGGGSGSNGAARDGGAEQGGRDGRGRVRDGDGAKRERERERDTSGRAGDAESRAKVSCRRCRAACVVRCCLGSNFGNGR